MCAGVCRTVIQEWDGWDEHKRDAHRADLVVEELRTSKVRGDLRGMAAAIVAQLHSEDDASAAGTAAAGGGQQQSKARRRQREAEAATSESDASEDSGTEHSDAEDEGDRSAAGRAQKRVRREESLKNDEEEEQEEEQEEEEEEEEQEEGQEEEEESGAARACWDPLGCGMLVPNTSVSERLHHWRLSAADIWIPRVWGLHDAEEFHSILLHVNRNGAAEEDTAETEGATATEEDDGMDLWGDLERVRLGDSVWVRATPLAQASMGCVYAIYTLPGRAVPLVNAFDAEGARSVTLTAEDVRAMPAAERQAQHTECAAREDALVQWLRARGDDMRARAIAEWDTLDADARRAFMRRALQAVLQKEVDAYEHQDEPPIVYPPLETPQTEEKEEEEKEEEREHETKQELKEESGTPPLPSPSSSSSLQPSGEKEEDEMEDDEEKEEEEKEEEKKTRKKDGGATELVSRELVENYLKTQKELLAQITALCRRLSPDGTELLS